MKYINYIYINIKFSLVNFRMIEFILVIDDNFHLKF
jgi:hypothetical protein